MLERAWEIDKYSERKMKLFALGKNYLFTGADSESCVLCGGADQLRTIRTKRRQRYSQPLGGDTHL